MAHPFALVGSFTASLGLQPLLYHLNFYSVCGLYVLFSVEFDTCELFSISPKEIMRLAQTKTASLLYATSRRDGKIKSTYHSGHRPSHYLRFTLYATLTMAYVLSSEIHPVRSNMDDQVRYMLANIPPDQLKNCAMSHLYMIRWDEHGIPSAYGLKSQRNCVGTADNHKRDRKLTWAKKTIQRLREATSVYTETAPFVPISRRLSGTASIWWADDYLYWINKLFDFGPDQRDCRALIFVFTANVSQPCQILVPALFEYDLAQDQVYRLRRSESVAVPWVSRRPQLFYRGKDYAPESCAMYLPRGYRPRRKLDLLSRKYPEIINASIHKEDAVDLAYFAKYRYVGDIGGVSCTTWSALHWKLSSGSLVFVVEHPGGLVNWWMKQELKPWKHYVPIKSDYSDLFEIIKYYEYNYEDAIAIAARGQRAALEYTQTAAFDALASILLKSVEQDPPALVRYTHTPSSDLWYCAIGPASNCEIHHV